MHIITASLCILGFLAAGAVSAGPPDPPGGLSRSLELKDTNIHFTGRYCDECHRGTPRKGEPVALKHDGNITQLCWCHGYSSGKYIHPVDIEPSEEKKKKIPPDFPLQKGKITCLTCHDVYAQCQDNAGLRELDSFEKRHYKMKLMFLRGASFRRRTTLCFKCHDEERYRMLDPHNQLDEAGNIVAEKCLYCHTEKPDEKTANYEDVKLVGDLKVLCQRCHGPFAKHPARTDHYVAPSEKAMKRIKKLESDYGIILPLDWQGKMTCVTCHNPHEKGVLPSESAGAGGASEKFKHRLPKKLCQSCHGM